MRRALVMGIFMATIVVAGFPSSGHAEGDDPATTAPPTSEGDGDAPTTEEPGDGSSDGDDTSSGSGGEDDPQLADVPTWMWVALGALLVLVIVWSMMGDNSGSDPETTEPD